MNQDDRLTLTVPNDITYLQNVLSFVRESARLFGSSNEELMQIDIGLEEAVANVMQHTYDVEENRFFDTICYKLPTGIKIVIKERGIPFDPKQSIKYEPGKTLEEASASGLGMFLMRQMMDEVSHHNLGHHGKETHLVKYFKDKTAEPDAGIAQKAELEPNVIKEKIAYDIRGLDPKDAIQISKCAYKSHGYTFFDDHIYFPERLIQMNESGDIISAVAVTEDNVFMGHAALLYQDPEDKIAELTFVFVNVEYRGQGAFSRLIDYLFFQCPKPRELHGIYTYAVANHIFTQKAMIRHHINDCGILLATSPSSWKFRGIVSEGTQRISVILSFKYMGTPKALRLYPPAHHRVMIERLYRNIDAPTHEYAAPDTAVADLAAESVLTTGVNESESCAEIYVRAFGRDVVRDVRRLLRGFCLKPIACINLFVSLENPATCLLTEEFEKLGFFFAGILPGSLIGDALILQYLNNIELDYSLINAYSEMAGEILAYIKERDPNASI